MTILCMGLTIILLLYPEEEIRTRIVNVSRKFPINFNIDTSNGTKIDQKLSVSVRGSFIQAHNLGGDINTWEKLIIKVNNRNHTESDWILGIVPKYMNRDFKQRVQSHLFDLDDQNNVTLTLQTTSKVAVPLALRMQVMSSLIDWGMLFGNLVYKHIPCKYHIFY